MSKFKVGDHIVGNALADGKYGLTVSGWRGVVTRVTGTCFAAKDISSEQSFSDLEEKYFDHFNEGGAPVARRTFKLIKETPTMVKGAIFQEEYEGGEANYTILNGATHDKFDDGKTRGITRTLVENQPSWFVEVFAVEPQYMTREELDKFEAFKKTLAPARKARTKKAVAAKPTATRGGKPAKAA